MDRRRGREGARIAAELLAVVPVFGQHALTAALLGDVANELDVVGVVVVDNGGDYAAVGFEHVITPGANLGWLGACNLGLAFVRDSGAHAAVLLNNDTRLSPGFFAGLRAAWEATRAGIVGPVYDDVWPHQRVSYAGSASGYEPRPVHRKVAFLDGTCMLVPRDVFELVGPLDDAHFGRFGWGADFDYALRVRDAGLEVYVTELAYLSHVRQATARLVDPDWEAHAGSEMNEGMRAKWGSNWQLLLEPVDRPTAV